MKLPLPQPSNFFTKEKNIFGFSKSCVNIKYKDSIELLVLSVILTFSHLKHPDFGFYRANTLI